jgi:branched-chain amino acid transport system substrate-binding protein
MGVVGGPLTRAPGGGETVRRFRVQIAFVVLVALGAVLAACGGSSSKSSSSSSSASTSAAPKTGKPLTIGISLSLSGDFSDPGQAAKRGYELWADVVNAKGGVGGRKVQLKIVDDASSPNQVVTNYQSLITRDKVDLVVGPFSTLLTGPGARVADRYGYAFIEPAGGGPQVFSLPLKNVFFVQPAPTLNCGDPFVAYIKSLPAAQRPKTAAYPSLDDPFSSPIADRMRGQFEAMGIKTVYKTIYPSETGDLTPVVEKVAAAKPDMVVGGTQSEDAYNQVKGMVQLHFSPKFLFLSNGASSPTEFPSKVGKNNVNGIFSCGDWFPTSKASGNADFVAAYTKKYGGTGVDIDSTSAEAYGVGQLIEAVDKKAGNVDNKTIISQLHTGTWPTVEGDLSWNSDGAPKGSDILLQWGNGKLQPVYPPAAALVQPTQPKPNWGG